MDLTDDLRLKFDTQVNLCYDIEKDYCPDNAPDAILRLIFSGRPISVNWTILSNCLSMVLADSQI